MTASDKIAVFVPSCEERLEKNFTIPPNPKVIEARRRTPPAIIRPLLKGSSSP
jgi:hypothetical protein